MARIRIPLWSSLTRGQRFLLATVVAVVVLFAISVAAGGRNGAGGASSGRAGVVGWLGHLIGGPVAVDRADVRADCLHSGRFEVSGSCVVRVAQRKGGLRELRLRADNAVTVTSRAPSSASTVSSKVDVGKEVKVTVDSKGGDIVLDCTPASTCVVELS